VLTSENTSESGPTPVVFTYAPQATKARIALDDELKIDIKEAVLASLAEFFLPKDTQDSALIPVGLLRKRITTQETGTTLQKVFQALGVRFAG